MKCLTFVAGSGRVRSAQFEERSLLPLPAACVVANAVREALAQLFGAPVELRLFAPRIPSAAAWEAIAQRARCYRVRGAAADATIVLRGSDALALARCAFGEPDGSLELRAPSPLEERAIARIVATIAASLPSICGTGEPRLPERVASPPSAQTYFELQLERPGAVRIGIAVSRDPASPRGRPLELDELAGVSLGVVATLDLGVRAAADLATLVPGTFLPITEAMELRGRLSVGGRTVARGRCGVRDGHYALEIDPGPCAGGAAPHAEAEVEP